MKKWNINKPDMNLVEEFSKKCDLTPLALSVMVSRGYTEFDEIAEFFSQDELSNPFDIMDMQLAAEIINNYIDTGDLICVYGDYDCDGITATTILYNYLENMGANVMYYINEREAGYGINIKAIEELAERDVKLIVTVDNGISALKEVARAKELGMKVVITDHHQPPEVLPDADAIVDPHRVDCPSAYKDTAGVGVAFKLCAALDDGNYDIVREQYSDLCAVGTVADIVPLTGENRKIVKDGLQYLANTERFGLNMIMDKNKIDRNNLNSYSIGFRIAPLINASGRMGSPITAVKALLSDDETEADDLTDMLITLNARRKDIEHEILMEILKYISENPQILNHRVLVLSGKNWHHGIIGIVSARILDIFGKPNFIISVDDNGEARGSARSVEGFNVFKCLEHCGELLDKFGGHTGAGGLSLKEENIEKFKEMVYDYSDNSAITPIKTLTADKFLQPEDLSIENVKGLEVLEPFGERNEQPLFAMLGLRVDKIIPLSQGKYTKIAFTYGKSKGEALMFSTPFDSVGFKVNDRLDMMVNLEINRFNGKESVSVKVVDYRISGFKQERYFSAKDCYEKFSRGENINPELVKRIIPSRVELAAVYNMIKSAGVIKADDMFMNFCGNVNMNYCKIRICIDIFQDKGLAVYNASSMKVKLLPVKNKVDINSSQILLKLREML